MSILIVEDDPISGAIIEKMLLTARYRTVRADSASEALKVLRDRSDIDLVLADIMMPELTGLDLLRVIKESAVLKDVPVIFCSSSTDIGKVRMAAALGCCNYLLKPIKRDLLLDKVSIALHKRTPSLLHASVIQSQLGIDTSTYRELERSFATLLKKEIALLDSHLKNPAEPSIPTNFPQLAEAAASVGAEQLKKLIADVSKCTNTGDFRFECMKVLREMHRVLELIDSQIEEEKPSSSSFWLNR